MITMVSHWAQEKKQQRPRGQTVNFVDYNLQDQKGQLDHQSDSLSGKTTPFFNHTIL